MAQKSPKTTPTPKKTVKGELFLLQKDADRLKTLVQKYRDQNTKLEQDLSVLSKDNTEMQDLIGKFDQKIRDIEQERSDEMKLVLAELKKITAEIVAIKAMIKPA